MFKAIYMIRVYMPKIIMMDGLRGVGEEIKGVART